MANSGSLLNLRIGPKMITAFLIIGIVPLAVVALLSVNKSGTALEKAAYNQLESVRAIKKAQIESFFAERRGDMGVLIETVGTLRREALNKLTAVRAIKKNAIESYFQSINDQVLTLSENRMIVDAMREFRVTFNDYMGQAGVGKSDIPRLRTELKTYYTDEFAPEYKNQNNVMPDINAMFDALPDDAVALQHQYIRANDNPLGSKHLLDRGAGDTAYNALHAKVHPAIRTYLEKFGYYDIFLVEPETGKIVYSVFKELDFATSLIDGPWAKTNFADVFKKALTIGKDEVAIVDYKLYTPSYEAPAGFIASPVFDGDERIGVLVFQMPLDRITAIMSERAGLGKTGETYLIGGDLLMRSDSYLDPEGHSVVASFRNPETGKVDTEAGRNVVAGKTGAHIVIDYNGNPVLSAYVPVNAAGLTWGLLAEIDVAEAYVPTDEEGKEYFAEYIERYGYYDLFLMNPDGYVFYSATHEADYQTNMVNGPYKDSGLGKLTRRVLASKSYGIVDFEPYPPSNNDPAAFIAQPVINDGKTEVVVALQLSLDAINAIMQQREGMGETGESYLVGQDKLMRSDSYLDPENHSVRASFANPELGSVDSVASNKGLAGETGSEIVIDYNGNPVLSSYTPVDVGDVKWALMVEIDEAEAFAPVADMKLLTLIVGVVGAALILGVGVYLARSISRPIVNMTGAMGELAAKNLEIEIPGTGRADEIGEMAGAVQIFRDSMVKADQLAEQQRRAETEKRQRAEHVENTLKMFEGQADGIVASVTEAAARIKTASQSSGDETTITGSRSFDVAMAAERTSQNIEATAAAAEELSASVSEISAQMAKSATVTENAVTEVDQATNMVRRLDQESQKISEVVALISDIAEQTNLLALNATIEAARAGDAGKGFAVVASEVKNLATQTAKATEQISSMISTIQAETGNSVKAIEGIGTVIGEINTTSTAIAGAVEEQNATTQQIADTAKSVNSDASVVQNSVGQLTMSAARSSGKSVQMLWEASQLSDTIEAFKTEMQTFLTSVRSN